MTESVKMSVLSRIDYHNYYGLGVVVVEIPGQKEMTFVDDEVYWRSGDATIKADDAKSIAAIAKRF